MGSQILNQSYNVAHYRALRNTDNTDSDLKVGLSFLTAVTASCLTSLKLSKIKSIGSAAPFLAVCVGTVANMALMRSSEILEGVHVYTSEGHDMGKSRSAGLTGVGVSIVGRVLTAAPPMLLPQVCLSALEAAAPAYKRLAARTPAVATCAYVGMLAGTIQVTTPWMLGALPGVWEGDAERLGVGER